MSQSLDPHLLERWLAGECDAAERVEVATWLAADRRNQAFLETLKGTLGSEAQSPGDWDVDSAWARMAERISPPRLAPPLRLVGQTRGPWRRLVPAWAAVAAALALVAGGTYLLERAAPGRVAEHAAGNPREYATARGQRLALRLDDGTQVTLGPDSRLQVAGRYGDEERLVHLEGEAYFDVVHDESRPFAVRAGDAIARDLGTRFTVRSRNEPAGVRVVVAEGKVALGQVAAADSGALLSAGDIGWLDPSGASRVSRGVDVSRLLSWTDGRLVFEQVPLAEVAAELGRWYDLDIAVAPALRGKRVTTAFQNESLDQMLDELALVARARYERSGTRVTFSPVR
jgi:transmembrane sensor